MLTKDDIKEIGQVVEKTVKQNNQTLRIEFGEVIEQNITPALDQIHGDIKDIKTRQVIMENKLDRALYHELDLYKH